MTTQVYKFGTGSLYGMSTSAASPQTPLKFGALQDVSVDFSFTNKELHGQQLFPLAVARGTGKVTGKATFAQVYGEVYNDLFFGDVMTPAAGINMVTGEAWAVPATPFAVTVANSAKFLTDLGVQYANGGGIFTKVASAPAVGQYMVAAGVYTFDATDTLANVLISYTYSNVTGKTIVVANQLQGQAPTFQIWFATTYNGQQVYYQLNACVANKLSMPSKMADWNIDEFDFDCMADSSGNIATIAVPA